jgi:hypothetical protein
MKKILSENQRDTIDFIAGRSHEDGLYKKAAILRSILTSVDEAEKRLAELEPPDLRTEEFTFSVTYDANVLEPKEVVNELQNGLKGLPFTRVDLILPSPEDIIAYPGEGFRWLNAGEILQEGDQYIDGYTGEWEYTSRAGCKVYSPFLYRRRVN